ncbi:MAG: site-specific DNA-methyltransferase [Anaerolineales bacterium]|nr:site-specific DNA-methyltransferase [Anaerolineales bacterium]
MGVDEFYQFLISHTPTHTDNPVETIIEDFQVNSLPIKKFVNEFWTSRQRQSNSLHEISYRACFKAQLPNFFITKLTSPEDLVYDPFGGRGTTIIEANLRSRRGVSNDINPLSSILTKPRLAPPEIHEIADRLNKIEFDKTKSSDFDLSMFYHKDTEGEIVSLRHYLNSRSDEGISDTIDDWIRMVATNRLTGHSKGFFSVYTLPPNQATSQKNQHKINIRRKQLPEYRNIKELILRKSSSLLKGTSKEQRLKLKENAVYQRLCIEDARHVSQINDETVKLIVTSPPFLDIVNYKDDNWLRCWFNSIDLEEISKKLTVLSSLDKWIDFMQEVFLDLYRVTKIGGWVAFEVGEVRKGKIKLDEYIAPVGEKAGFNLFGIIINKQNFTKTSNIWGINNNEAGTNTNRIVVFYKE